jgi:hypothetical protein
MPSALARRAETDGRTLATVTAWAKGRLARRWSPTWEANLEHLADLFETHGEPAYGVYNRELFRPIHRQLTEAGFPCRPVLPGTMPLSVERWGPEDHRERRMWTLVHDGEVVLGALVTRFFHDHTDFRLPLPPMIEGLPESDHDAIRALVIEDPAGWPTV